jgi:hypothetical protein
VGWLLTRGHGARAGEVADAAGEVYSARGLALQAALTEAEGDMAGAEKLWAAEADRYESPRDLLTFHVRANLRNPRQFAKEADDARARIFPHGMRRFTQPPDGPAPAQGIFVRYRGSETVRRELHVADVVVAIEGWAAESSTQSDVFRPLATGTDVHLVVWREGHYVPVVLHSLPPTYRLPVEWEARDRGLEINTIESTYDGRGAEEWVRALLSAGSGQDAHRAPAVVAQLSWSTLPLLEPVLRQPADDAAFDHVMDALDQMAPWQYMRTTPILLDHLRAGPDRRRLRVLSRLGHTGFHPGVVDALLGTARDGSPPVRLAALSALGEIGFLAQPRLQEIQLLAGDKVFEARRDEAIRRIRVSQRY